jgi:hypothetical protein
MAEPQVTIEIFDPPMCCPTGLCGPAIDPALLDVHEAILRLEREQNGVTRVVRYLLAQQPAKFMEYPEVLERLKRHGVNALPITTVNRRVVKERVYPTFDELAAWIGRGEGE